MVGKLTAQALIKAGYLVSMADDGDDGLRLAAAGGNDLALIDLELPARGGLSVIRSMRDAGQLIPIIILTGRGADADVVAGLDAGADDYLVKPVGNSVLLARVRAALRRAGPARNDVVTVGLMALDRRSHQCTCGGTIVPLTVLDYALLEYFMLRPGEVVSRADLLSKVWGMDFDPGSNMVDAAMNRLRSKLHTQSDAPELTTIRGMGFVLRPRANR